MSQRVFYVPTVGDKTGLVIKSTSTPTSEQDAIACGRTLADYVYLYVNGNVVDGFKKRWLELTHPMCPARGTEAVPGDIEPDYARDVAHLEQRIVDLETRLARAEPILRDVSIVILALAGR